HHNKTPKFASEEVIDVARRPVIKRFPADRRCALKRILTNVDQRGHVRSCLFARPAPRLLEECELEIVQAHRTQVRPAEVEDLMPRGRPFAFQQVHLVVTVKVILVTPAAELNTVEQLIGDIRIASGGAQCRKPIETGYDSIFNCAWLDMARP